MRTRLLVKNSIYSLTSFIVLFVLGMISRKVLLTFLSVEFLGFEGLFTDLFAMLSLAEMGIGSVITYNLYQEIAVQNKHEIAKLMAIYKYVYRLIGSIVLVIGLGMVPFLEFVIKDRTIDLNYMRLIYVIQLMGTIVIYFLEYRRVLFIANQMEFVCIRVDTVAKFLGQCIKIMVIFITRNYILYLLVSITQSIVSNLIISKLFAKSFGYAVKSKVSWVDFKKRKLINDIGNSMVHKISYLIYSGVDNIVISIFLGISTVGYFSNYILIKNQVWVLISKLLKPIQATIGNIVYSEADNNKGINLFYALDTASFFLGSFIAITFFVMIQSVIEIWIGNRYILPLSVTLLLAINIYIESTHETLYYYRSAFGEYERDRKYMLVSAIINLTLSILLVKKIGLAGVLIGTCVGLLIICFGRMVVVFDVYIKESYGKYTIKHSGWGILAGIEGLVTYHIAEYFPNSFYGLVGKLLVCLFVVNGLNILFFHRTKNFGVLKKYFSQLICAIRGYIQNRSKRRGE